MMKNSTTQICPRAKIADFFSPQQRPHPLIFPLSGWIFHRNIKRAATDLQTNFLPYFLLAGRTRHLCPRFTKWLPQQCAPAKRGKGGREGEGWEVMTEAGGEKEWMEGRALTHMWQDRAVLLMGREKYDNLKKRGSGGGVCSSLVMKQAREQRCSRVVLFPMSRVTDLCSGWSARRLSNLHRCFSVPAGLQRGKVPPPSGGPPWDRISTKKPTARKTWLFDPVELCNEIHTHTCLTIWKDNLPQTESGIWFLNCFKMTPVMRVSLVHSLSGW